MAKRESQGLQIALILFVMITVVLAVTTFVFYRKTEEAVQKKKAAEAAKLAADQARDDQIYFNQYFMHIFGAKPLSEAELGVIVPSVEGNEEMAAVHVSYTQDIKTYGEGLPQDKLNYRELPANLIQAIRKLNTANTELSKQVATLIAERDKIRLDSLKLVADAEQNAQKANDDYAAARDEFNTARTTFTDEQAKQFADYQTKIGAATKLVTVREVTIKEKESELKAKDTTISIQKDTITELRDEPFESPDGRVAWVNQANRTLWINLGMADGLRRQTTFSVYDHDAMNVDPGTVSNAADSEEASRRKIDERKGMIEVTRIIDQHLAEARIVDDYTADPILPGDVIFSPAWKPGRKIHFGLVGLMDLDDDGRSDRDLVRNIISMGGGQIDAEVHDDGTTEGELTANTRYLVRGAPPDGSDPKLLTEYSNMMQAADNFGVQKIELLMLLEMMGYKPEVRTIGLGKHADPLQFKAEPEGGASRVSSGATSDDFRSRQPPRRKSGGSTFD